MSIKEDYSVSTINRESAKDWLLYKHYAKTIPQVQHYFGLFNKANVLEGVCAYGSPANNHNNNLGEYKVLELVRLVVNDGLPKNTLSFFVSATFDLLEKPLVLISYADQGKNHCGYIYQATNWMYTGLGGGVDFYRDKSGKEIHSRIMSDYRLKWPELSRDQIAEKLEWIKVKGTFKHRYFYFLADKKTKKHMLTLLKEKYTISEYPKEVNVRYDSSHEVESVSKLF